MGGKELAVKKTGALDLREVAARTTLREIRLQGHVYVELRQVGKRTIFFCTLCQTPCFNDSVLSDHLKGNLHARRYAAAKVTLFGPVPWPFSDGVLFFNNSCEKELYSGTTVNGDEVTSKFRAIGIADLNTTDGTSGHGRNVNNRMCNHNGNNSSNAKGFIKSSNGNMDLAMNGHDKVSKPNGYGSCLVIPGVLLKEEVTNLRARFIGYGHIGSKIHETSEGHSKISRIWCAWLGQGDSDDCNELLLSPKCDFAIVNLSYTYDLGRRGTLDELDTLSPGSFFEIDDLGNPRKKRKKSFSDPEDSSVGPTGRCGSSGEECSDTSGCATDASHQLQTSRLISNKVVRRELRKHKRMVAERTCDICGQPMLIGKDVATLLNCKTGKLACSSRNINGAFHLFHTSCLVHWILLCEFETWTNQSTNIKTTTRGRKAKLSQKNFISSVFCPECQGTGIHIKGDELEKPTVPLSEMFLYKLKAIEAHKAWMRNPEVLQRCSTGLHFPSDSSEKLQEKAMPVKLLHFYRADE